MNNLTSNFSDDMSKYVVTAPPLPTTVAGMEITLPAVVFEFDTGSSTTPADVASALQSYVGKCSPVPATHASCLCTWLRRNTNLEEGITSAFERALVTDNGHSSLGSHVASVTDLNLSYKLVNELRLAWARHCITALLNLSSQRNKEESEKHDFFSLLRPVKFKVLAVGDKLAVKDEFSLLQCSVIYKSRDFVVLRFKDDSESAPSKSKLEINYGLAPLCWVEGKPVYPGDGPLYYKDDPAWRHNEEGVFASSVRDDDLHFHGGMAFPIDTATWTKPEQKRVPSFQVEGQDVFPGDTVYYYGANKDNWGDPYTVKENTRLVQQATGCFGRVKSFDNGAATFRLKPMLVIGDHLVPMPVRDTAEMKNGEDYYIPSLDTEEGYLALCWTNHGFDFEMRDKGLVHLNKEAASAHTKAFIAISKKKD